MNDGVRFIRPMFRVSYRLLPDPSGGSGCRARNRLLVLFIGTPRRTRGNNTVSLSFRRSTRS